MSTAIDRKFQLFKDRWKLAVDAEKEQRKNELDDLEFEAGDHWDPEVKKERERNGKPCITIDLLSGPIKQVTNAQRNARPGIQISPVGQGADPKKAERWQGIIRRIERLSQAGRAYSWAGQYQVKMGRGVWVVRNIEVGESGEQDIRICEVDNQHSWYCDPTTKKLNGEDKKWAIGFEDLTHEEYITRFGETKLADALQDGAFKGGIGDAPPEWITSKAVRIAEYYYLVEEKRIRLVLSDGQRVWEDELPITSGRVKGKFAKVPQLPPGATVARRVPVPKKTVHWCLLNGLGETLEETTIPGAFIPVVTVFGERRNINGKVDFRGMVRMAKGPSRMEDWAESSLMEAISEAKTAPWLAEWSQIAEFKAIWESRAPVRVLPYTAVSGQNGQPLAPPQRVSSSVDVSALTMAAQRMQNHVRQVTGNADVFQEETSSQQANASGRAIFARKLQQELGTSDYQDNLGDGIVLTAKICMSMARETYDTPRLMRILGEDEKEHEIITYKGDDQREHAMQMSTKDVEDLFDVSVGEYDITVSVGKNYQTQRQETVDLLNNLIPQLPPDTQAKAFPILIRNLDGAGALELAAALEGGDTKIPPEVRQQLQQADQLLQMAQQRIQQLEQEKAVGAEKEKLRGEIQLAMQELKGEQSAVLEQLKAYLDRAKQDDQQRHEVALAAAQAGQSEAGAERQAMRDGMAGDLAHRRAAAQPPPNGTGEPR